MGKFEQKKRRKLPTGLIVVASALAILGLVFLVVLVTGQTEQTPEVPTDEPTTVPVLTEAPTVAETTAEPTVSAAPALEFPVSLADGKLQVESLFQFSGVNPDAGKQKVSDVASIVLKNITDKYLSRATVTAVLDDGSERVFIVNDIPAGASVMAFSIENQELRSTDVCISMFAEAVFEDATNDDLIKITVDGLTVTLENASAEDLNEMNVYYHDVFDNRYFGGVSYTCIIETLSAGESMTITAEESLLGAVEVVRVAAND